MRATIFHVRARAGGFTLVELAVVLTIVALLLASLMYTLSAQIESRNQEETRRRLEQARELVLSFAIVNGRMPCPARYASAGSNSAGLESFCTSAATSSSSTCPGAETTTVQSHGTCSNHFDGYVPAASLGYLQTDPGGFAIDAWGNRIRYAVTRTNANCSGTQTPPNSYTTMFTSKTSLQTYGIGCQPNDLIVCKSATGISGTDCGGASNQLMAQSLVVAVIFSPGKNANTSGGSGLDEAANLNGDRVFVSHPPTPSDFANGEFDDQMTWITVGELYGRLVSAGLLP
jgi:prepilin-type N-terminal cleavage/methylation domain-containing protein